MLNADTDKARKHGLDEFVQANPSKFDHHDLFSALQRFTLVYRLNDNFACLVRLCLHQRGDAENAGVDNVAPSIAGVENALAGELRGFRASDPLSDVCNPPFESS